MIYSYRDTYEYKYKLYLLYFMKWHEIYSCFKPAFNNMDTWANYISIKLKLVFIKIILYKLTIL